MSEHADYRFVRKIDDVEVREYKPYLAASTVVTGQRDHATDEGFRRLAGYIVGGNRRNEKIAMTVPVTQAAARAHRGNGYELQFIMPREMTRVALPAPDDSLISLVEVPARTVASLAYRGRWTESLYQEKLAVLRETLRQHGMKEKHAPLWARYNSPAVPFFLRHNEIWLEVEQ